MGTDRLEESPVQEEDTNLVVLRKAFLGSQAQEYYHYDPTDPAVVDRIVGDNEDVAGIGVDQEDQEGLVAADLGERLKLAFGHEEVESRSKSVSIC